MRVVGTAGHVDHGKSTLVQALTGIDPDRLREEKARGLTIDLGFAWLTLPSQEAVGIVDVPGHIDFIKNMLAGVGSIDAALFVVAADEGTMPQTREHLDILDLLEVPAGVVALTKVDLIEDPDWLDLVQADLADTLDRTILAKAPIIPVSAMTGQGIPELLESLDDVLQKSPARPDKGRPRLWIDRVFTVSGFGTVVTGTLIDGAFNLGQEVEILPQRLPARIRGLQSHKQQVETATPGSRVAINLAGVSTDDLKRGDVVTLSGWLEPSQLVDTRLRALPDLAKPLKHNQAVELFSGSLQAPAHLRLLETREIAPGEEAWVQLRLDHRIPIVKGDRFIIRQASPSLTIGGGVVVDPLPRRRHKRFRPELIQRLETLAHGTPEELLGDTLDRIGPIQVRHLLDQSPLDADTTLNTLDKLFKNDRVLQIPSGDEPITNPKTSRLVVASTVGWRKTIGQIESILLTYHQTFPLRLGIPRSELQSRLKLETGLFNRILNQAEAEAVVETSETATWLAGHTPQFSPAQEKAIADLLARFRAAPYATPSAKESLAALNQNEEILNTLVETGRLIRLNQDVLLLPETFDTFLAWLKPYIDKNGSATVAQVRDAFDTSRKYALGLLEYTDAQRLTRRVGDERVWVG